MSKFFIRKGRKVYDPDKMNDDRAKWANAAIESIMASTGTDRDTALQDLLTNLMHWADREKGGDFERDLERARYHYAIETSKTGEEPS